METDSIRLLTWITTLICGLWAADDTLFLRRKMEQLGLRNIETTRLWFSDHKQRSHREAPNSIEVRFSYKGEKFSLALSTPAPILHPSADIVSLSDRSSVRWTDVHPNCFLTGTVTSHPGIASFSVCDQVIGIIKADGYKLHVQSLSEYPSGQNIPVLIGQGKNDSTSCRSHTEEKLAMEGHKRSRRAVTSRNITIETAVYTDAAYTKSMLVSDFSKRLQHILLKYHAVQMEWSRFDELGYHVKIVLKKVHFYESDPSWYNASTTLLGHVLSTFCEATKNDGQFDIRYMHVGLPNLDVLGRAYQNSVCDQTYNCAVDRSTDAASFAATAHEIGHLSGRKTCLWEENIPTQNVPQNLADVILNPSIPGQTYSPDQVCELKFGAGYRFRKYPKLDVCVQFSCANHNRAQSNYGQMFKETTSIFGMYCDKSKICFKMGCVEASTAKLSHLVEREGGWSQWGPWTGCTRTCGRGINYRKRKCDNPAPINFKGCNGDGYEAESCNIEPCPNDSSDQTTLRNQRASETCKKLRDNDVINPDLYNETGSRYSDTDHGQCEVSCDSTPGHTTPSFTRFGFMPDGVTCVGGSDPWDRDDWPRKSGSYYMCLDGLCQRFGCDNKFNGKVYDECGVCGGDNSSCAVVSKTDTEQQSKGDRRTIAYLPAGAFNIQFWFKYSAMNKNFVEIWDKTGQSVLASMFSGKFDTRNDPVVFAGTRWYFYFYTQFLHAKGPLTESCEIKLFQNDVNNNVGVNFIYSEPKSVSFDCDFEDTDCGVTMNGFVKDTYGSLKILESPNKADFGESFVYIASLSSDKDGTILTSNITGKSHPQCLAFNYYLKGVGSNITVAWESKPSDVIGWTGNPNLSGMVCAVFSISTLEVDKILIKGVTKAADQGAIVLDNIKLFPDTGKFCNAQEACTRDVFSTTTLKPIDTTSGSSSTTARPTTPSDKLNKMLILGIAIGCFVLVILVVVFAWCSCFKPVDQQGTHCRVKVFSKKDSRSQLTHLEDIQVYIENHPDYDVENCPDYD
ncbi:A disintegrin and metalloproteinase with thrombospondin motifs 5-like isoform X3 [Crassostrea virginica]